IISRQEINKTYNMCSVQKVGSSRQLNEKEKAALLGGINKAKDKHAKVAGQDQLVVVNGTLMNLLPEPRPLVMLNKTHSWKGQFISEPPKTIGEADGSFVHQGNLPVDGGASKGALIYGTDDQSHPQLGFLVAWYKPLDNTQDSSKVYAVSDELSKVMEIDLSKIEQELDASSDHSRYYDTETNAIVGSLIKDEGNNTASFAASFHRLT
ncbi:Jasmonate-induced protein-like protein, partial [Bienertia sinuspersici]